MFFCLMKKGRLGLFEVFETLSGPIYHGADSHFSNYFVKHGKGFDIEVAINNYGLLL